MKVALMILITDMNTFGILLTVHAGKDEASIQKLRVSLNGKGLDFFAKKYETKFKLHLWATLLAKDDKDCKLEFTSGIFVILIEGKTE